MRFPPLLVNSQFNRSNLVVTVKNEKRILNNQTSYVYGEDDRMDQNTSVHMVNLSPKKWWWQRFRFVVDVPSIILTKHQQSHLNLGEYKLDTLGFHRAIVNVYYHLHTKKLLSTTLFTSIRSLHHPKKNLPFAGINHWVAKDSQ